METTIQGLAFRVLGFGSEGAQVITSTVSNRVAVRSHNPKL